MLVFEQFIGTIASLFSQSWLLTLARISAGEQPLRAVFLIMVLETTINSAAGIPLPDTSAMTMAK